MGLFCFSTVFCWKVLYHGNLQSFFEKFKKWGVFSFPWYLHLLFFVFRYYEGILLIRRLLLASFTAIPFHDTNEMIYSMIIVIIFCLVWVMFEHPFLHTFNNYAEMLFQSILIPIGIGFICMFQRLSVFFCFFSK